jgi:hypothetical protein
MIRSIRRCAKLKNDSYHDQVLRALSEKANWEIGAFKDIVANKENFLELQHKEYARYENLPLEDAHGAKIEGEFTSDRKTSERLNKTLFAKKAPIRKEDRPRVRALANAGILGALALQNDVKILPAPFC